jgi:hypothetical protein
MWDEERLDQCTAVPDTQDEDSRSRDMWNGARSSRGLQAADRWLAAWPAELRVLNAGRTRRSAGREPRPRAHKEEWLPRLWSRSQSIPSCVLHLAFLFSRVQFLLLMESD